MTSLLTKGIVLAHCQIFKNAPLHHLKGLVILIEDAPRLGDIDALRIEL
jgi:hypothetical protein